MLNCREASRLASKRLDAHLPLHERLGLALHLRLCGHCRRYARQLQRLRRLLQQGREEVLELSELAAFSLASDEHQRLTRALARGLGEHPA